MLVSGSEANDHLTSSPSGNHPQGQRPVFKQGYVAASKGPLWWCLGLANGGDWNAVICQELTILELCSTLLDPKTKKKPWNPDCPSVDDSATSIGYFVVLCLDEECKSCTSCHVDKRTRTLPQHKQHIRRCNQPPPGDDSTFIYIFNTYAGLRQHVKRSHLMEYNANDNALKDNRFQTSKPKWSASEER